MVLLCKFCKFLVVYVFSVVQSNRESIFHFGARFVREIDFEEKMSGSVVM
jgi:hypothetical protein